MHKVWVDIQTGEWGLITDIRVLDVQWWDEFVKLFNDSQEVEIIRTAKAFGKPI